MKLPSLDKAFRFPPDHCFTPDRIATEYRMLIRGYLAQVEYLFNTEAKVQEIRDCVTRIHELTTALSAHELGTYFRPINSAPATVEQEGQTVSRETEGEGDAKQ